VEVDDHVGTLRRPEQDALADDGLTRRCRGYSGAQGQPEDGKFTLTLRRGADGRWLIMSDMDNSNRRRN